jgi:multidrug efflux pump subunit AcrA (membrane-fusion protein)
VKFVKPLISLIFLALFISACSTTPGAAIADSKGRGNNRSSVPPRQVEITTAEEKALDQLVIVTGTLAAEQEVVLGFKVPGRLAEIPVDLGSSVQKSQAVAKLDTTDFELRVRQADAALQQARVRLGLAPDEADANVVLEETAIACCRRRTTTLPIRVTKSLKPNTKTRWTKCAIAKPCWRSASPSLRSRGSSLRTRCCMLRSAA